MSRLTMLAAIGAALTTAGAAQAADRSFPAGGEIHSVSNSTPFDVYVHTGKAVGVHATGPQEALDRLVIENRGGELRVRTKSGSWMSGWHWGKGENARIDITAPMIGEVSLAGPGNITVDAIRTRDFGVHLSGPGDINVGSVEASGVTLDLSGPGDIHIAGRADRAVMHLAGPGNIHAEGLRLGDADVTLSGPGDIDATVTRNANVQLSGPGDVNIRGGARCSVHKSGPGDVNCS
jgi:hypothetical protein